MSLRPREIAFDEVWTKLYDIIKGVITLNRMRKIDKPLWHNTFSDVYMLCVAHPEPHSKQLYEETRKLLENHVIAIHEVCLFLVNLLICLQKYFNKKVFYFSSFLLKIVTKNCSIYTINTGMNFQKAPNISIIYSCNY
jgi:hypothetical protein